MKNLYRSGENEKKKKLFFTVFLDVIFEKKLIQLGDKKCKRTFETLLVEIYFLSPPPPKPSKKTQKKGGFWIF